MEVTIKQAAFITVVLLIIFSCSPNDLFEIGPDESITISVSDDSVPVFSWDNGPIHRLFVMEGDSVKWGIITPESDNISSPVTYGIIPDGAELFVDLSNFPNMSQSYGNPLCPDSLCYVQAIKYYKHSIGSETFYVGENK